MTAFPIRLVHSWIKGAELLFFPSFCKLCSKLLELPGERVVCRTCLESLKPHRSSCCLSCGRFFESAGEDHLCHECLDNKPPFARHRSCGLYEGKLKDLILLFKYRCFQVLGKDLAAFALRSLGEDEGLWWGVEYMIPVPLHPQRQRRRGFNQAQILAKELARMKGIELAAGKLLKVRNVPPQTSLEAVERKTNLRGAFRVVKGDALKGKVVLLVDDVFTTGSTIKESSLALRKAGVKEVRVLTLAQA